MTEQMFLGTKRVKATPMTRQEYNDYRCWGLPAHEDGDDKGFLVEYLDGGKANHPAHEGYISWSPEEVFNASYQDVSKGMSFGHAIEMAKLGCKVARSGWNGKNMWVLLTPDRTISNLEPNSFYDKCGFEAPVTIGSHFDMKAADGSMVVGWLASQSDMLADDWIVVD